MADEVTIPENEDGDGESQHAGDYRQNWRAAFETYAWIWRVLMNAEARKAAKWLALNQFGANLLSMAVPWFIGQLVNALMRHELVALERDFAAIVGLLFVRRLLQWRESHLREVLVGENTGEIDLRTNELFLGKSLGQHLREHETLSAAGMEKGRARAFEGMNLLCIDAVETFFLLGTSYVALWCLNWVAGVATTLLFVIYVKWSLYLNRKVAEDCLAIDQQFRAWQRHRSERWEQVGRVKVNGKEQEEGSYLSRWWNERIIIADRRFWLWFSDQHSLRSLISTTILLVVMGFCLWQAWHGHGGYGLLFPLFIWMQNILEHIWRLGSLEHRLSWNLPSLQAMERALKLPQDIVDAPDAVELDLSQGVRIEFRNVTYVYEGSALASKDAEEVRPEPVLRQVSFTIEPGEVVAFIGPSGAGKTSIMRLLQRSFDPTSGSILVNGHDLRRVKLASWLGQIGYISQQPAVLDGTLRYNLLYGLSPEDRDKVTDEELWTLMRRLKIDFGKRLTKGLKTKVGKNGIQLSGGEQQRVMIGAAIAKRPRFLVCDEITSALDSTTERAVQRGVEEVLMAGVGAAMIAHRLSSLRGCDKFIVLKASADVADGESQIEAVARSFEELYAISPTFQRLADDQGIVIHPTTHPHA